MSEQLKYIVSLSANSFSSGVNQVVAGFRRIGSAAIAVNQSVELVKNTAMGLERAFSGTAGGFISTASKFEKLDIMLRQVEGSAQGAAKAMEWIGQKGAQAYGLDAMAEAFVKWKNVGLDPTKGSMDALTDALAAFGKTSEQEFMRAVNALQKMAGTGNVQADELKQELGEAIPGAVRIMARELNMEIPKLFKEMEKGALSSKEAIAALLRGFDKDYRGMTEKMADTWDGLMNQLGALWKGFQKEVMNDSGLFRGMEVELKKLIEHFQDLKTKGDLSVWAMTMARNVISALKSIGVVVGELVKAFAQLMQGVNSIRSGVIWGQSFLNDFTSTSDRNGLKAEQMKYDHYLKNGWAESNPWMQKTKATIEGHRATVAEADAKEAGYKEAQRQIDLANKALAGIPQAVDGLISSMDKRAAALEESIQGEVGRAAWNRRQNFISGGGSPAASNTKTDDMGTGNIPSASSGGDEKGAKAAKKAAEELAEAIKRLAETQRQAQHEFDTAGLDEYAKAVAGLKFEEGELNREYAEFFNQAPQLKEAIRSITALKEASLKKEAEKTLLDAIKDTDFDRAQIGASVTAQAVAQLRKEFDGLIKQYPDLKKLLDALEGKTTENIVAAKMKELSDQVKEMNFEAGIAGLNEMDQALARINYQAAQLREQYPQMSAEFLKWYQDFQAGIAKSREVMDVQKQISEMQDWTKGLKTVLDAAGGQLGTFLNKWMETGKFSLKEMAQAFVKELNMIVARYTAELLVLAVYSGIRAIVALAMKDTQGAAQWGKAAASAAIGAGVLGGYVVGAGLAGQAHSGISEIPEDGTWLLKKKERVVDAKTNADLKKYLANGGGKKVDINMPVTIQGGDEQGVLKALPKLREHILDVVNNDIMQDGQTRQTILNYTS